MKDKNRKLFHKLLDIVLDKEPESGVEINVASMNSTAEVWFFEVQDNGTFKTKKHYDRYGDGWRHCAMRDTITGCPERALEPPERADQERLNRLQDMREAETAIGLYLEDYKDLFSQEIENFLDDLRMAVYDFEQEDEE